MRSVEAKKMDQFDFYADGEDLEGGVELSPLPGVVALGIKVVVLDDDDVFRKVIERHAKQVGIEVQTVATVDQLASAVSNTQFDAVVIDYYLENDLGSDVAEAIPKLPVILTSRKSDWLRSNPQTPPWIKEFVHKKYGAKVILQRALCLALKTRSARRA